MRALTREEAEQRAKAVAVDRYAISVDLREPGESFTSTTSITFTACEADTFVELHCDELLDAELDGTDVASAFADDRLSLDGLRGRHELVVRARMRYSHDGEGLHRFVDPADEAVYLSATSSVDNAKRWFACFDQPDLKARFELDVLCPPEWTVIGNGAATRTEPGRWHLATTPPIATYLVTLVAGTWHSVLATHDGIPLGLHVRQSLAAELDRDAPELFRLTAASFDAFHSLFEVRYPFGGYHQAFVPELNWGAMENPGCVTFRDQMIFRSKPTAAEVVGRVNAVVHEMAHMWFGDLVTMRWWDDLWLNESFAEYLAHRVTSEITDLPTWEDFAAARKAWGYAADRRSTTHPVAGNGAPNAQAALNDFDGISYAKGASVLRQLASYLGDEMFLAGLRHHVRSHAYGNATFADLLASWAAHARPGTPSSDDLTRWAQQWLRTEGVDIVAVDAGLLRREPPVHGPAAQRPHAMSVVALPAGERRNVVLDGDTIELPVSAGLVLPNAGDETWATVRLAAEDWSRLPGVIGQVEDPVSRTVIWNALRTVVDDGLVPPALAVRTVVAGLPREIEVVVARVLAWITLAVPVYLAPGPARDFATLQLAEATRDLLSTAPPGSSAQLTAARAWVALTDEIDTLRRWSKGDAIDGLAVDDELHWSVLRRRAGLGDLSTQQIDEAFDRDRSASGAVHAQGCRALRPDAEAKAKAWAALIDPSSTLSQYQLVAIAGGLVVAGQEDLVAPYAARWFDEIPTTQGFRSGWALNRVADACFPSLSVNPTTLVRAEEMATREDLPSGFRRIASDRADDLRRALAVRTR